MLKLSSFTQRTSLSNDKYRRLDLGGRGEETAYPQTLTECLLRTSELVEASKRCLPILLAMEHDNWNLTYTIKQGSRVSCLDQIDFAVSGKGMQLIRWVPLCWNRTTFKANFVQWFSWLAVYVLSRTLETKLSTKKFWRCTCWVFWGRPTSPMIYHSVGYRYYPELNYKYLTLQELQKLLRT